VRFTTTAPRGVFSSGFLKLVRNDTRQI